MQGWFNTEIINEIQQSDRIKKKNKDHLKRQIKQDIW